MFDETLSAPNTSGEGDKITAFWVNEIERAEKIMKYWSPVWRRCRSAYENFFYRHDEDNSEIIERPLFYANVKTSVSNLVANPPFIIAKPMKGTTAEIAQMLGNMLKAEFRKNNVKEKMKQAAFDLHIYNVNVTKVGYNSDETYNYAANSAFVSRVSPFNLLIDPECVEQDDARWEGEKMIVDFDTLTAENGYINLDKAARVAAEMLANKELNQKIDGGTGTVDTVYDTNNFSGAYPQVSPSKVKKILVYEIYDKVHKKVIEMAEGKILIRLRDFPPYIVGSPYIIKRFNKTPDFFFGRPDYMIHKSQYGEINRIENRLIEYSRRMIPKILISQAALGNDRKKIEKIEKGEMCEMIVVDGSMPLDQAVKVIFNEGINPENYNISALIKNETDQDTGVADFMRGSTPNSKTATGAQMAQAGASARALERLAILEDLAGEIARKILVVKRHTAEEKEWVDYEGVYPRMDQAGVITMMKDNGFWVTPDVLWSDLYVAIETGSMAANNFYQRQQSILNLYNLFSQNQKVNQEELIRVVCQRYDLDPEEMLAQTPPALPTPKGAPPPGLPNGIQGGNPSAQPSINQTPGDLSKNMLDQMMSAGNANVV